MDKQKYSSVDRKLIHLGLADVIKHIVPNEDKDPNIFINASRKYPNKASKTTDYVDYMVHIYQDPKSEELKLVSITAQFFREVGSLRIVHELDFIAGKMKMLNTQEIYEKFCDIVANTQKATNLKKPPPDSPKPAEVTPRKKKERIIKPDNKSKKLNR